MVMVRTKLVRTLLAFLQGGQVGDPAPLLPIGRRKKMRLLLSCFVCPAQTIFKGGACDVGDQQINKVCQLFLGEWEVWMPCFER